MSKKVIASLSLLVAVIALVSGCSQSTSNTLMSQIEHENVIKVAVSKDDAPYSYQKSNSLEYDGIEVQIAQKLADSIGVTLEVVPVDRQNLLSALTDGTAHIAMGRLPDTVAQQYETATSISYLSGNIYAVTKRGSFLSTVGALNGKVVLCSNKLSSDAVYQIEGSGNTTVLGDDGSVDITSSINDGILDAYICYGDEALTFAKSELLQVQVITNIEPENYVICTLKNNEKLVLTINETLTNLLDNDIISEIVSSF